MRQVRVSSKKLGQLLVERGRVSGEQVLRAIMSQRAQGGRLGTCLLELELVKEDHLLETLAEQQGAPPARVENLRAIPEDIVHLIPPRVAARCRAVPFSATDREVDVATLDARDMKLLDELAFATSRRVRAHVVSEVRIYEALARYYGVECPRRYSELVDRLNRSRYLWKDGPDEEDYPAWEASALHEVPAGAPVTWNAPEDVFGEQLAEQAAAPEAAVSRDRDASPEQVPREDRPAPSQPPGQPLTLGDVNRVLQRASDVTVIGKTVLQFLGQSFEHAALFRIRQDRLVGWLGHGEGLELGLFRAFQLDFREPSVFLDLVRGTELHLGALPPMPAHRRLVRCWGGDWPAACLVLPVRIADRVTVILYGDRRTDDLADLNLEEWRSLAAAASDALELSIMSKKLQAN